MFFVAAAAAAAAAAAVTSAAVFEISAVHYGFRWMVAKSTLFLFRFGRSWLSSIRKKLAILR